ncbi:MAG TPA: helix-turn-helix domain-containing protein, partial [Stellaceae bacterium]
MAQVDSNPDAAPIRSIRSRRVRVVKPTPDLKALRARLRLTQEAFAHTFSIPVANVRDWEQGRSRPDSATIAYLRVIEREPDTVKRV